MSILLIRLSILTIAKGSYYRDKADNKRLKEIPITAPRGEIRDRNGKLIAGNKPSFTVQLFKDELDNLDRKTKNNDLLQLVRLLEEDGVTYLDEFPIELNVFKYRTEEDYRTEEISPKDKVLGIIMENNLLYEIVSSEYNNKEYSEHYDFKLVEFVMQSLRNKGIEMPIFSIEEDGINKLYFRMDRDIQKWKLENELSEAASPMECIMKLLSGNNTAIREILEHPISRKIIYDKLVSKGLSSNIVLSEYALSYDEDFKTQKRELMKNFKFINFETSGEEDFLNIFKEVSMVNFMNLVREETNFRGKEVYYAPGEELVKLLKEKDRDLRFKVIIDEEDKTVNYQYQGKKKLGGKSPVEFIIAEAERLNVLDEFLKSDTIRTLAQSQLLRDGVNTRISIGDGYEYIYVRNKEALYTKIFGPKDLDLTKSPEEAFNKFREKQEIDEALSKYEARGLLAVMDTLSRQGHRAYEPINIAYSIKDTTVAKIEEGMADIPGLGISIEPIRFYPEGETAAHVLGYLGRISQQSEIDKYIDEKGYSPNDIIGKTGIEESFEDYLRGENGYKRVEVDSVGNTTRVLAEKKPKPGNNIYLSIDLDLQKEAERVLEHSLKTIQVGGSYQSKWGNYQFTTEKGRPYRNATSGATVAVDVRNGDVLAMASYPAYDPNLFATGISSSDWASLFPENELDQLAPRPLYNIATQSPVQPGSTFKMVTALSALEKGLSPTKTIRDMGYVNIGSGKGGEFSCYLRKSGRTHGAVDVEKALEVSCNYYFYSLALGMNQKTGESLGMKLEIEDIVETAKKLGLNDKTGIEINIPSEASGGVPDPKVKEQGIKNMLRNFLNKNIKLYIADGVKLSDKELENIIEEVVNWTDKQPTMTKPEVVRGLGEMGINGERKIGGNREDLADTIKYTYLNQAGWTMADTLNVTIGQGQSSYTPIQMANYVATITNGGYNNKLTLINNIKDYSNSNIVFEPERESERIELNNYDNLESLKHGMLRVSNSGSSRRVFAQVPEQIGSKTGTAEKDGIIPGTNQKYDNFGWFVGFAPYEKPEIAVASVIFQGGGGANAGPMTRDIIAEYLGLNSEEVIDKIPFENKLTQ